MNQAATMGVQGRKCLQQAQDVKLKEQHWEDTLVLLLSLLNPNEKNIYWFGHVCIFLFHSVWFLVLHRERHCKQINCMAAMDSHCYISMSEWEKHPSTHTFIHPSILSVCPSFGLVLRLIDWFYATVYFFGFKELFSLQSMSLGNDTRLLWD